MHKFDVGQKWLTVGKHLAVIVRVIDENVWAWHDEDDRVHAHNKSGELAESEGFGKFEDRTSYWLHEVII